jgi:hypothetical protein
VVAGAEGLIVGARLAKAEPRCVDQSRMFCSEN